MTIFSFFHLADALTAVLTKINRLDVLTCWKGRYLTMVTFQAQDVLQMIAQFPRSRLMVKFSPIYLNSTFLCLSQICRFIEPLWQNTYCSKFKPSINLNSSLSLNLNLFKSVRFTSINTAISQPGVGPVGISVIIILNYYDCMFV